MLPVTVVLNLDYSEANRVDPDEAAPTGAASSGSTLFAETCILIPGTRLKPCVI